MEMKEQKKLKSFIQAHNNENEIIDALKDIDIETELDGGTALIHAVNYNRTIVVKYLVEQGANVNTVINDYYPLISACESDDGEIVKLLLDAGADVSFKDSFGNSALWKAAFNENAELVKLLLDNGANPFDRDNNGDTYYESAKTMGLDSVIGIFEQYKK